MARVIEEEAREYATTHSKRAVLLELDKVIGTMGAFRARGLVEKSEGSEDRVEFLKRVKTIQGELDHSLIPPDVV